MSETLLEAPAMVVSAGLMLPAVAPDNRNVDDLTKEFLLESMEGLDRMELCLAELEERPDDAQVIGEIFRAVHTIKGTTGFLGFHRLESLSHAGENLLSQVRDGRVRPNADVVQALLQLMDGLRNILQLIEATGDEGKRVEDDDSKLIESLVALQVRKAEVAGDAMDWIRALAPDEVAAIQHPIPLPMSVPAPAPPTPSISGEALPISVSPNREPLPANGRAAASASESTLRVDVDLLNRMMNLVGELVLTRNRILQTTASDQAFAVLGRRLDLVTADLRESVMKARMQPVGYVFQKFPRMVRDLARTCGRQVRLELEGQDTELDKSLLEAVRDPITHAVRNSVDHGIESPEARLLAGKPRDGVLRLAAFQQGGHVVIEITDDGAGIAHEKILAAALKRNLISQEKAASLTPRDVLQLIFVPGFSTAKEVTSISGRGVGMDVVRTNVEKIGGKVEIDSEVGVGTRIRMRIPLTLAIIPALVVSSGGHSFAIPQSALFELAYLPAKETSEKIEWIDRAPVYRLRNQLLPLVWLDQLLSLPAVCSSTPALCSPSQGSGGEPPNDRNFYIAVLEADGRRFGLVVDELLEPEEIVVKPLASVLRQEQLFSGATVLGNGELALIVDPSAAAARAGLLPQESAPIQSLTVETQRGDAADENCPRFLVFSIGAKRAQDSGRFALPLEAVERIETVPFDRIEFVGGNAVLQFRGGTLPLWDGSGLLSELEAAKAMEAQVSILVCHDRDSLPMFDDPRLVGLVVREVIDVNQGRLMEAAGAAMAEEDRGGGKSLAPFHLIGNTGHGGNASGEGMMALLNGRITPLFDLRQTRRAETVVMSSTAHPGRLHAMAQLEVA